MTTPGGLLLGYLGDDGKLVSAGRVGIGMAPEKVLRDLRRRLIAQARTSSSQSSVGPAQLVGVHRGERGSFVAPDITG